jgi:predicted dehydrogenase
MLNAALIGLGWWGKNHLTAAAKSARLRIVHGVSKEVDAALPLAEGSRVHALRRSRASAGGPARSRR